MFTAYSRSYVDLKHTEVVKYLSRLLLVKNQLSSDRLHDFEKTFARYIGVKEAVSFPYCRTSMYFAMKALDFPAGSEVILPAFTFWVDAAMVELAGLKPVFVDVDLTTMNMDPGKLETAITNDTVAIFPTHLNGMATSMESICQFAKQYNLRVLEDCARSCGAEYQNHKVGSFDIGTFSFGYGKGFYCMGGGMVTSDDSQFIAQLRKLKSEFGVVSSKEVIIQTAKASLLKYLNLPLFYRYSLFPLVYRFQVLGQEQYAKRFRVKMLPYDTVPKSFLVDMNAIQVDLGFKQLDRVDEMNKRRSANARILSQELAGVGDLSIPPDLSDRNYIAIHYAVWTEKKRELQKFLTRKRIDSQDESAVNLTGLSKFQKYVHGEFPQSEKLDGNVIFLPTHPSLGRQDMLYIAQQVKDFFGSL